MSNIIQIKRGQGAPNGKLAPYELGLNIDNNALYVGGELVKKEDGTTEQVYGDAIPIFAAGLTDTLSLNKGGTGVVASSKNDLLAKLGAVKKSGDTMTGTLVVPSDGANPSLKIQATSTYAPFLGFYHQNDHLGCGVFAYENCRRIAFRSYSSLGNYDTYENFFLPSPSTTNSRPDYHILTSKSPVDINQGGTGATTEAGARTNLGLGTMATENANNYLTSSQIQSNYIRKTVTDDLFYKSTVSDLGYKSNTSNADKRKPISMSGLAFWNGAYGGTSSNLLYCNKGAFGDAAVASMYQITATPVTDRHLNWNVNGDNAQNLAISLYSLAYWDGRYSVSATDSNLKYCKLGEFDTMAIQNASNYVQMKWKTFSNTTNSYDTLTLTPDTGYYPLAICGTIRRYNNGNSANNSETVNFYTPVSGTVNSKTTFNFTVYQASVNGTMHINSSNQVVITCTGGNYRQYENLKMLMVKKP